MNDAGGKRIVTGFVILSVILLLFLMLDIFIGSVRVSAGPTHPSL